MFQLKNFTGRICSGRTGYEFLPQNSTQLNLEELSKKLNKKGVFVEIETPDMLLIDFKGNDISIFKTGKILIKNIASEAEAKKIANLLMQSLK